LFTQQLLPTMPESSRSAKRAIIVWFIANAVLLNVPGGVNTAHAQEGSEGAEPVLQHMLLVQALLHEYP
jgi:hypothetical protein